MDVWLVEDNPELRASLSSALRGLGPTIRLTQVFGTAGEALQAVEDGLKFDVGLLDLGLPDLEGDLLIERIVQRRPHAVLLALTVRSDDAAIFGALRAGAVGYLLKDSSIESIASAVAQAFEGGSPLSPSIARRIVRKLQPDHQSRADFKLTTRELQVLELLCTGGSYRDVASTLRIAEATVHTHVKRVYDKLGAASKAEAVRIAFEARLFPLRTEQ